MADGISKGRADKVQTEEDLSELKCTPGRLRLPVSYRFAAAEPAHTLSSLAMSERDRAKRPVMGAAKSVRL